MRREMAFIWLALALGLTVVGYSALNQTQMPIDGQDTHTELVGQIVGSETIGQTFLARYHHLHRVDVFMGTYARPNTRKATFRLKTAPDAPDDILMLSFNAADVEDHAYHCFTFPPIPDSAGRTFYFSVESPDSVEGDAISIWMQPRDLYTLGTMFRNGAPEEGDLHFQIYYQGTWQGKVTALLDRLAENKPSIWGDKRFYVLLAILTVGGLVWLLSQAATLLFEDEGK